MMNPLFSIIVVSLNAESTIGKTLQSVLDQSFGNYEIIVKDGCSKDSTLSRIPSDNRIRVVSKPDKSVYDAMNQAVQLATGTYFIFMNCGDCFYSESVLEQVSLLIQNGGLIGEDIIYGNYAVRGAIYKQPGVMDRKRIVVAGLCHQSIFTGKRLFDRYGDYDSRMKVCADYEHMARLFVNGVSFHYMDETICDYQGGGISEKPENLATVRREGNLIRDRYFTKRDICYYNFSRVKNRMHKIFGGAK